MRWPYNFDCAAALCVYDWNVLLDGKVWRGRCDGMQVSWLRFVDIWLCRRNGTACNWLSHATLSASRQSTIVYEISMSWEKSRFECCGVTPSPFVTRPHSPLFRSYWMIDNALFLSIAGVLSKIVLSSFDRTASLRIAANRFSSVFPYNVKKKNNLHHCYNGLCATMPIDFYAPFFTCNWFTAHWLCVGIAKTQINWITQLTVRWKKNHVSRFAVRTMWVHLYRGLRNADTSLCAPFAENMFLFFSKSAHVRSEPSQSLRSIHGRTRTHSRWSRAEWLAFLPVTSSHSDPRLYHIWCLIELNTRTQRNEIGHATDW